MTKGHIFRDSVWFGAGIGIILQLVAAAVLVGVGSGLVFLIGVIQLAWVIPLAVILPRLGQKATLKGLLISSAPTLIAAIVIYGLLALGIVFV